MNLFDPLRPKLTNSRPTWLRDHIAIPHFEIFPLENGNLELSMWLPIKDETFASRHFKIVIEPVALHGIITNFINDPEQTCEYLFKSDPAEIENLNLELRRHVKSIVSPEQKSKITLPLTPVILEL